MAIGFVLLTIIVKLRMADPQQATLQLTLQIRMHRAPDRPPRHLAKVATIRSIAPAHSSRNHYQSLTVSTVLGAELYQRPNPTDRFQRNLGLKPRVSEQMRALSNSHRH